MLQSLWYYVGKDRGRINEHDEVFSKLKEKNTVECSEVGEGETVTGQIQTNLVVWLDSKGVRSQHLAKRVRNHAQGP